MVVAHLPALSPVELFEEKEWKVVLLILECGEGETSSLDITGVGL